MNSTPTPAAPSVPHHYAFAHWQMRQALFTAPDWLFAMAHKNGDALVVWLWEQTPKMFPAVIEEPFPAGLGWGLQALGDDLLALWIGMPEPREPTQVHQLALTRRTLRGPGGAPDGMAYRCFTLERRQDLGAGEPPPVLCEWRHAGEHLNTGDSVGGRDVDAFLAWVAGQAEDIDGALIVRPGDGANG